MLLKSLRNRETIITLLDLLTERTPIRWFMRYIRILLLVGRIKTIILIRLLKRKAWVILYFSTLFIRLEDSELNTVIPKGEIEVHKPTDPEVIKVGFPLPVEKVFEMFFSNGAKFSFVNLMEKRGIIGLKDLN